MEDQNLDDSLFPNCALVSHCSRVLCRTFTSYAVNRRQLTGSSVRLTSRRAWRGSSVLVQMLSIAVDMMYEALVLVGIR